MRNGGVIQQFDPLDETVDDPTHQLPGVGTGPGDEKVVVVQTPAEETWDRGDSITFAAPPERTYLFDAETGDRIR